MVKANKQFEELFGELFDNYSVGAFGQKRVIIGERDKTKRVCRFCNNTSNPLTFESEAHAISEGLGNKTIILNEECDACNDRFSMTIEPDIIQYLSLFRTIFDVKGKGGSKKFKGENFELSNDENVEIKFYSIDDRPDEFSMPYTLKLETKDKLSVQNIYRTLCKYYLSVIDSSQLDYFKETIKWINGELSIEKLPKIGELISYHGFTKQPKLVTYLRINDNNEIPYAVGEFYFTCKIFVFIVPLCSKDSHDFVDNDKFDSYWRAFQHLDKTKGWVFMDYSNDTKRILKMNLNFQQNTEK